MSLTSNSKYGSVIKPSKGYKVFRTFNYILLIMIGAFSIIPMINILAISLSSSTGIASGVSIFPKDFTLDAYKYVLERGIFWRAFANTIKRISMGVPISMILLILCSYPLSKSNEKFPARKYYIWIFIFAMLFNGGLIPTYLVVNKLGLINSYWSLVLPVAVNIYNIVIMSSFFRNIPIEIEEAASIDGCGPLRTLISIYLPNALPALATLGLFILVYHWNEWFFGQIFISRTSDYPMQSYLRMILVAGQDLTATSAEEMELLMKISGRNHNASQIFISMIPILVVYPMLQRYFVTGLTLGSVKG